MKIINILLLFSLLTSDVLALAPFHTNEDMQKLAYVMQLEMAQKSAGVLLKPEKYAEFDSFMDWFAKLSIQNNNNAVQILIKLLNADVNTELIEKFFYTIANFYYPNLIESGFNMACHFFKLQTASNDSLQSLLDIIEALCLPENSWYKEEGLPKGLNLSLLSLTKLIKAVIEGTAHPRIFNIDWIKLIARNGAGLKALGFDELRKIGEQIKQKDMPEEVLEGDVIKNIAEFSGLSIGGTLEELSNLVKVSQSKGIGLASWGELLKLIPKYCEISTAYFLKIIIHFIEKGWVNKDNTDTVSRYLIPLAQVTNNRSIGLLDILEKLIDLSITSLDKPEDAFNMLNRLFVAALESNSKIHREIKCVFDNAGIELPFDLLFDILAKLAIPGSSFSYYFQRIKDLNLSPDKRDEVLEFIFKDENDVVLLERVRLSVNLIRDTQFVRNPEAGQQTDFDVYQYLTTFVYGQVSRNERLNYLRGINNLFSSNKSNKGWGDSVICEWDRGMWENYFKYCVPNIGFTTNLDIIKIVIAISENQPLDGANLEPYQAALASLGVVKTGVEGLTQLKNAFNFIAERIISERDITDNLWLNSDVSRAILGVVTGVDTAIWGHGAKKSTTVATLVDNFNSHIRPKLPALESNLQQVQTFGVNKAGQLELHEDEEIVINNFKKLIRIAHANMGSGEEFLRNIKIQLRKIIDDEVKKLEHRKTLSTHPIGLLFIEQRFRCLNSVKQRIYEQEDINSLLLLVAKELNRESVKNSALNEVLSLAMIWEVFNEFPEFMQLVLTTVERDDMHGIISHILALKHNYLKHLLKTNLKTDDDRKLLLRILQTRSLEIALERIKPILDNPTTVNMFLTNGILGELAGDLGDACYTSQKDIMLYPNMVGAAIFSSTEGGHAHFLGSMLILKNTYKGEPVWILRAINPSEDFMQSHDAESFLRGMIEKLKPLAQQAGVRYLVTPFDELGALSNRSPIHRAMINFVGKTPITLDSKEDFNGFDIQSATRIICDFKTEELSCAEEILSAI